jgi:ankyrin repeat protein
MTERMNRIDQELLEATKENNLPEVSRLLSVGADVNAKDNDNLDFTPLHWASKMGHLQVFQALLDHGADFDAKGIYGETPLHLVCHRGLLALVQALLSRGANTEAKTNNLGNTPLHSAAIRGHFPVVKALLSRGADCRAVNSYGELAIHFAVRHRNSEVSKYLLREFYATISIRLLPLHELLKDLTWIINLNSTIRYVPPLRYALHWNVLGTDDVVEILEYLVDRDPTLLRSRYPDGSLPLHAACSRGAAFTIVQSLVNIYKASVKSVNSRGDLPLFLACEMPETSLDTIFLLMKLYPDLVYR